MVLCKGENKLIAYLRDCVGCAEITFTFILALEQFVAVRQPFFYARLGKIHALLYLFVTCLIIIAFWIWLYLLKDIFFTVTTGLVILVGFFIFVANTILYKSVKKQCEKINGTIVGHLENKQTARRNRVKKRRLKSLKICIGITASYLLTWFPLSVFIVIDLHLKFSDYLVYIFQIFFFSNGIWDVVIYFYCNKKARRKLLLMKTRTKNRVQANE